jgi:hypothetical protein
MENERDDKVPISGHFEMMVGLPGGIFTIIFLRLLEEARAGKPWATEQISGNFARVPCVGEYLTSEGLGDGNGERLLLRVDAVIHSPAPQLYVTAIPARIALQNDLASITNFYERNFVTPAVPAVNADGS